MAAYYNEHNKLSAQWLRELIREGAIAPGDVDERSIEDVTPNDIRGYTQCHFFAGVGAWSYALREAGWPDDRQVWTGSCPCQPYSKAGKRAGNADKRNLWPAFYHIISQLRPLTVFGEQVGGKNSLAWLDTLHSDLENIGYTVGAVDSPAAGYGAPHIRQRLYWVGTTEILRLGDLYTPRLQSTQQTPFLNARGRDERRTTLKSNVPPTLNGVWSEHEWLMCHDGKYRPTQPGIHPLAHRTPSSVGRLRGYGNSIVTEQAKEFIKTFMSLTLNK